MTILILGGYYGTPQIWTLWQFSFWGGGILGHLRFGLSDNFHLGGILWHLRFGLYDNFHFEGGIMGHLRFGLSDNFHFGEGYSRTPQIWTLWQFSFWGEGEGGILQNRGILWDLTKISTTPAGSCIRDSLSHTTYVETNDFVIKVFVAVLLMNTMLSNQGFGEGGQKLFLECCSLSKVSYCQPGSGVLDALTFLTVKYAFSDFSLCVFFKNFNLHLYR